MTQSIESFIIELADARCISKGLTLDNPKYYETFDREREVYERVLEVD